MFKICIRQSYDNFKACKSINSPFTYDNCFSLKTNNMSSAHPTHGFVAPEQRRRKGNLTRSTYHLTRRPQVFSCSCATATRISLGTPSPSSAASAPPCSLPLQRNLSSFLLPLFLLPLSFPPNQREMKISNLLIIQLHYYLFLIKCAEST